MRSNYYDSIPVITSRILNITSASDNLIMKSIRSDEGLTKDKADVFLQNNDVLKTLYGTLEKQLKELYSDFQGGKIPGAMYQKFINDIKDFLGKVDPGYVKGNFKDIITEMNIPAKMEITPV